MNENDKLKVAPHSKESEMMVLGCMMTSINSLNVAADLLDESDFYHTEHKIVFSVLKAAFFQDKPADVHLVAEELKRQDRLKAVGGIAYLTTLVQFAGTSAYIDEYAELVKDKAVLRRMIHAAQEVEKKALKEPDDVSAALDEAQAMFFSISQSANPLAGKLLREILVGIKSENQTPFLKELEKRQERFREFGPEKGAITGIPTGFLEFDKIINGLNKSNLMILAARPAMGKTALAINIAENVCFHHGIPVGIFSLEMSADQLVHRIVCSQSQVMSDKIKTGNLTGDEFQRIVESVNRMQGHTLIIDDQAGLKITDLRARARRMRESYGIEFLVIDYLQLLSGSGANKSQENRQMEISEISRMLKTLARELNIPIMCLSQLSRRVEERQGHRPLMSDLRESGCLSADTVIRDASTGQCYTIKELAEREVQTPFAVQAIDPKTWKSGIYQMTNVFYSGKKTLYALKTRTGRLIKASRNHPFLKLEGWTALENLKVGDKIATPRSISSATPQNGMCKEELILLAHLIGDGCVLPKQPYHYTSADLLNIDSVKQSAEKLFKIRPRLVRQKNWYHLYLPSPYRLTHHKKHPITNWYDQLGLKRVHSYEKKFPEALFSCDKERLKLFINHLWSTDGNISEKNIPGRKTTGAIYYASSSRILVEQLQHLLLNFEIQSSLRTQKSKYEYRHMHHLYIEGSQDQLKFLKEIGSNGVRGQIVPDLIHKIEQINPNPNYDVIPKEAWSLFIEKKKNDLGLSWRSLFAKFNQSYSTTVFKRGISRRRMDVLFQALPLQELYDLSHSDVYWDEIVSIRELGEEDVYDATVPSVHNFLANDLYVHNSIEQDADIVMFLLRREYYDPQDKPGQGELIIGKNRHGAVGSVHLAYRKEIARFENLEFSNHSYHPLEV